MDELWEEGYPQRMMLCVLSSCKEGGGSFRGQGTLTLSGRWGAESWASLSAQLSPPLSCLFCTIIKNTPYGCVIQIISRISHMLHNVHPREDLK